ncbi:MAG: hypothetical protein K9W44_11890 [Candidatus Lokiarchaeota archaeon]|nr:hypothetical protein [Candidatus Harpocratesius repetitus]
MSQKLKKEIGKEEKNRNLKIKQITAIVFYYAILFFLQYAFFNYSAFTIIGDIILLFVALTIIKFGNLFKNCKLSRIFSLKNNKNQSFKKSISLAISIVTPLNIAWLIGIFIVGKDTILTAIQPSWALNSPSNLFIIIKELQWIFVGCLVFILWIALPIEILNLVNTINSQLTKRNTKRNTIRKFPLLIVPVFFSLLYNTPLITGKWDPVDIVLFGFLFSYSYYKTGNIWGICIAYFIAENPFWWGIAAFFGESISIAFIITLVLRIAFGCVMICYLLIQSKKKIAEKK